MERKYMNRGKDNSKCYCYYFFWYEDKKGNEVREFVTTLLRAVTN